MTILLLTMLAAGSAPALPEGSLPASPPPSQVAVAEATPASEPASAREPDAARDRERAPPREERAPILGVSLDGGFPDGFALSLLVRPLRPLRLDVGVTYNLIGFGIRGGATFVPFKLWLAPLVRVEGGHMFDADATGFISNFTTLTATEQTLLRSVGYDYVSIQGGLEFGSPNRFVFFVRAGYAWLWTTLQNFQQAINNPTIQAQNPKVSGHAPTGTVGLQFYFW